MPVSRQILGMNARNYLYIRPLNRRKYKNIADDKLRTKELLISKNVPTNKLLASFKSLSEVRSFDWKQLPDSFALKPSHGFGGRGITVVRDWNGEEGVHAGQKIDILDLEAEIFGALDGAHSLNNLPDTAFIEERIVSHQFFKKIASKGVPDIRVIVCNQIPVMAMMRLPTIYSDGKANLHLGALGVGIDMRTGITTHGVVYNKPVETIPGSKTKVRGIKIPDWSKILTVAVEAQQVSKLGFVGIDIVLDQNHGPLVLEINARPGLSIQIANNASLRTRLERVADVSVPNVSHGVELAQKLFAEDTLSEIEMEDNVLGVIEKVTIISETKRKTVRAKIDTGAFRTSIDVDLVEELGLDPHHKMIHVRSGSGRQKRHTVRLNYKLRGKDIKTIATYTERKHLRFPIIIGRQDLKGYVVDPNNLPEGVTVR